MNLYEPTNPLASKTRPFFLTRTKARTRKSSLDIQSISNLRIEADECKGAQRTSLSSSKDVAHGDYLHLPTQTTPVTSSKLKTTFSEIGHAVEELRCLSRNLVLRRTKSVVPTEIEVDEAVVDDSHVVAPDTEKYRILRAERRPPFSVAPRWLSRWAGVPPRQPRRAPAAQMRPPASTKTHAEVACAPDAGVVTAPLNLPDSSSSGAAARAAAAAQNEILGSFRRLYADECMVHRDSESGIGIEVRVRSEEDQVPVLRQDPVHVLPKELVTHILSFLDAASLISSELVCRRWHEFAVDPLVWREIFFSDFLSQIPSLPDTFDSFQYRDSGVGKLDPGQDWKLMWKTRKSLNQRWSEGYAAAVYLEGHSDSVYCVQFDEKKILTGSRDRTIRIWDAHTYECRRVLGVPSRNPPINVPPLTGEFNRRGRKPFATVVSPKSTVEPDPSPPTPYHSGSILCLQYDDDFMVTGSSDCTCITWDVRANYKPIRRLRYHTAGVLDVCFNEKHIVSCSKDTTVCLWDRKTGQFLQRLSGHRGPVNAVQLRGNLAVSASGDGVARLWNLNSGLCIKEFPSKDRGMACVEFSLDSRTIFAGGNDRVIYQFDTSNGELVRELSGHRDLVRSLHLDNVNQRVVSGSYDSSVRAYDARTGQSIVDFPGWTSSWILSAKADYRRIIATSQDSRAVIVDFGHNLPGVDMLEA